MGRTQPALATINSRPQVDMQKLKSAEGENFSGATPYFCRELSKFKIVCFHASIIFLLLPTFEN